MKGKRSFGSVLAAIAVFVACIAIGNPAFAGIIEKSPDIGPYWNPLSSNGTYIYANSFVAADNGVVTNLGIWLNEGSPDFRLQVYNSLSGNAANGPDSTSVIATTGVLSGLSFSTLSFFDAAVVPGATPLVAGTTYWFAASTVGLGGNGRFYVGGHTQNSGGIVDNGTFWYSNDSNGSYFDGQGLTPEMAFRVTTVPVPATMLLFGPALAGLAAIRRRFKK